MSVRQAYDKALNDAGDIREHLPLIAALADGCQSAATIGHSVETAVAMLKAEVPLVVNYHFDDRAAVTIKGIAHSSEFRCVVCDSTKQPIEEVDLLAIDSIHTASQLAAELRLNADRVRKTIVMHDTEMYGIVGEDRGPGLRVAIDEFLSDFEEWSESERLTNNHGLTVLARRRRAAG